ncbi:hypothetical protein [uncultured Tateyamaria sp.]|uniref:hypothetical protein n=1 Tax=uncultured Tateyamaria sp. TaxID=455651 RepID=UPI00261B1AD1|nr:hypothetical protein [uncultured Tateyamaria sp.]
MKQKSRVTILVKASPQPSKKHSETVCCAGVSASGKWKRLFPIRFRHLNPNAGFSRWDIVEYCFEPPRNDSRVESCRVFEDTIATVDRVTSTQKKANLVNPLVVSSELEAASTGGSLAVIRPEEPELVWKLRSASEVERIRGAFEEQAKQASMFDKALDTLEPCPYEFKMKFRDGDGKRREKLCGDWETTAAFFNLRNKYNEETALTHLEDTYCRKYVETGLIFALGNMASRPKTWQLLGIFPVPHSAQMNLF